jgi:hypothetical protein
MVASNAKAVLRKENELLDELIKTTSTFMKGSTGVEAHALNEWVNYFKEWRKINKECIDMTNDQLAGHLNAESNRLKGFVSSITSATTGAVFHKKSFNADSKIAKELLTPPKAPSKRKTRN